MHGVAICGEERLCIEKASHRAAATWGSEKGCVWRAALDSLTTQATSTTLARDMRGAVLK
eukprot:3009538-Rhodomonas_salina.3